ncbi:MAG: hypothetical protein Sylvanvirus6_15 [Sylvanvirus sp.]|uniref:Uncharacterized protein n=1 Tax=Sylvanvirus sp. TaxID=2487774 RepID=A0A3G5AJ95_9VIRU|nr:MAG: hypothetical protein Sylvanvirus6_15 [Sylvanvirus sp.]
MKLRRKTLKNINDLIGQFVLFSGINEAPLKNLKENTKVPEKLKRTLLDIERGGKFAVERWESFIEEYSKFVRRTFRKAFTDSLTLHNEVAIDSALCLLIPVLEKPEYLSYREKLKHQVLQELDKMGDL